MEVAFGILAEEVEGRRRGDRDDPEDVVHQQGGDQQQDVVQQQGGDQQQDVPLLLVAPALELAGPALVRESEGQREVVEEGAQPTSGIAAEKALGGTTGGSVQSRASLG